LDEQRFSVAAYAVIQDDRGRVLLTRRREGGEWVLPGGTVAEQEVPWEAVVREVAEETGLEASVDRLVGVYAKPRERDLVFVFEAGARGGELRASEERDRVEFADPQHLPEGTGDRDRKRIADALAERSAPVLEVQPSEEDEPPGGVR
jgi:ADP-ribose pyrophosphatase YjhB (NUDIX family)